MKIAIVIHAFYPEQLKVILGKIQMILSKNYHHTIDVYITLPFIKKSLQSIIDSYSFPVSIHWCENKGMDLLPFFELIPSLQHYDWVLKLHTKNNNDELNQLWFDTLIDELVGSPDIFKKTIEILEQNQDWKMAGILPFFLSAHKLMLKNRKNIDKLAKLWGLNTDKDWGFFAGSFYWVKPQALNSYAQILLKQKDWFDDEFAKDGLFAHAVERLISLAVGQVGLLYGYAELCIDSQHKFAINQAFSYQLLENIQNLDKIIRILTEVYPLDVKKYEQICGILFSSDELALKHYVLVGQFGDCAHLIPPIALQRKQEKLFSWHKLKNKQRIKGLVSIVIPVLNETKLTLACLKSIKKYTKYANIEVIVVDNGSDFLTSQALNLYAMTDKRCKIIHLDENLNFAVGCNYGFSQSNGEYVLFLNNDTVVTERWLTPLIEAIQKPEILAVQPLLLYPNNTVQCAGVEFGDDGFGFSKHEGKSSQDPEVLKSQSRPALTGACLLLRADDFVELKGFSPWFINGQEDMDLCLRLQNLYPNKQFWYCAESIVYHYESSTVGREDRINQNRTIFYFNHLSNSLYGEYMKKDLDSNTTYLQLANRSYKQGFLNLAYELYVQAVKDNHFLKGMVIDNLRLTCAHLGKDFNEEKFNDFLHALGNFDGVYENIKSIEQEKFVYNHNNLSIYNVINQDGIYYSETDDPTCLLDKDYTGIECGFYLWSFQFFGNMNMEEKSAKIYLDCGDGYNEINIFRLFLRQGFNYRIIHISEQVKNIRFDPVDKSGAFLLKDFCISKIEDNVANEYINLYLKSRNIKLDEKLSILETYGEYNKEIETYYKNSRKKHDMPVVKYVPRDDIFLDTNQQLIKPICFYLPQFHPIPENDKWWGKGFTEWTNVIPAQPQFEGHYQPHIPDEYLGYYSLLDKETQKKQIELAKQYGIYGFCYYLYWFTGHRLLEQPLDNMLNDPTLDFPFCICWANENWSRRWDGLDQDLLMVQNYSDDDDLAFIQGIAKYLKDPRYIEIDGKPLLMIYRPNLFPNMKKTVATWRTWCRNNGIGDIYLVYPQSFESVDPSIYDFDAACEFPPNNSSPYNMTNLVTPTTNDFQSTVYDWTTLLDRSELYNPSNYTLFRGSTPSWDNTARKKNKAIIFSNSAPELFNKHLVNVFNDTVLNHNPKNRLMFINAWNEWAEGAHLEPDQRYGYGWLKAVRDAHEVIYEAQQLTTAIVIHAFYPDVLQSIMEDLLWTHKYKMKFYISTIDTNYQEVQSIMDSMQCNYQIEVFENKGRDVLPFLQYLPTILQDENDIILKLHTKRSLHRRDGELWRKEIYGQLLSESTYLKTASEFVMSDGVMLVSPSNHLVRLDDYWGDSKNKEHINHLCNKAGINLTINQLDNAEFIAGTMFYARANFFEKVLALNLQESDFDNEAGQVDGTLAHALERFFGVLCYANNLNIYQLVGGVQKWV